VDAAVGGGTYWCGLRAAEQRLAARPLYERGLDRRGALRRGLYDDLVPGELVGEAAVIRS
jgi:hypothetical protein